MAGVKKIAAIIFVGVFLAVSPACSAEQSNCNSSEKKTDVKICKTNSTKELNREPDQVEKILAELSKQTGKLKSYQAQISYLFVEAPAMLDMRTLRKGMIYYLKDENGSQIRINFLSRRQDDDEEQKYRKEYIFDGVRLVEIDYRLKQRTIREIATKDNPRDIFEFISGNFPIIGFGSGEDLRKDFSISHAENSDPNLMQLHLEVKKGSKYEDKYKTVEFWVDKKVKLPMRVVANSTEGDIYDIKFIEPQVNKKIKMAVFKLETPADFSNNVIPLKEK
jgi:outer membrane lipoprotein-sorting protein